MEVVFSLFRIISSFLTDNLYEQSLVNHLFSFNLAKKIVTIKKKKNIYLGVEQCTSYLLPNLKMKRNPIHIIDESSISTKNKLNGELSGKINALNDNAILYPKGVKKKKKKKIKIKIKSSNIKMELIEKIEDEIKNINNNYNEAEIKNNIDNDKKPNQVSIPIISNEEIGVKYDNNKVPTKGNEVENNCNKSNQVSIPIICNKENRAEKNLEKNNVINDIKISNLKICFCFCWARKIKNLKNVLLKEGMRIIMEKMDILYMFKKMVKDEDFLYLKNLQIDMSEECKNVLIEIGKI
jgi:hypothetical protein